MRDAEQEARAQVVVTATAARAHAIKVPPSQARNRDGTTAVMPESGKPSRMVCRKPKEYRSPMPLTGGAQLVPDQVSAVAAYVWSISHNPAPKRR